MAKLESIEIRPAKNGGHLIRHEFARQVSAKGARMGDVSMERPPSEEHSFGPADGAKVMAHLAKHLGLKSEAKEEAAEA